MLSRAAAAHLEAAGALTAELETARAALAEAEARANAEAQRVADLAACLDAATGELAAVRATATWRAHGRLLPVLRTPPASPPSPPLATVT